MATGAVTALSGALLGLVLAMAGCGGDSGAAGAGGGVLDAAAADASGGADASVLGDGRGDAGDSAGGSAGDDAEEPKDVVLELPRDRVPALVARVVVPGPSTAGGVDIQPAVAVSRDGHVGLAWTGSTSDKVLGIWFALLGPDGSPVVTPIPLDTTALGIRNEPSICALGGDGGFVVAWSQDTQEGGANLQVRFRRIDAQGAAVEDEDVRVLTEIPGNHWLGRVACGRNGGFTIVGVRPDADGTFGVFMQRYGVDGAVSGAAEAVNAEVAGTQVYPVVGLGPDGLAVVAWDDSEDDGGLERVLVRRLIGSAASPSLQVGVPGGKGATVSVGPETGGFLAAAVGPGGLVLSAFGVGSEVGAEVSVPTEMKGVQGVALGPIGDTGRHAFFALVSGSPSTVARLAVVDADGVVDGPVELAQGKLPPYRPSVAGAAGRIVAAWTESLGEGSYATRVAIFGGEE